MQRLLSDLTSRNLSKLIPKYRVLQPVVRFPLLVRREASLIVRQMFFLDQTCFKIKHYDNINWTIKAIMLFSLSYINNILKTNVSTCFFLHKISLEHLSGTQNSFCPFADVQIIFWSFDGTRLRNGCEHLPGPMQWTQIRRTSH